MTLAVDLSWKITENGTYVELCPHHWSTDKRSAAILKIMLYLLTSLHSETGFKRTFDGGLLLDVKLNF